MIIDTLLVAGWLAATEDCFCLTTCSGPALEVKRSKWRCSAVAFLQTEYLLSPVTKTRRLATGPLGSAMPHGHKSQWCCRAYCFSHPPARSSRATPNLAVVGNVARTGGLFTPAYLQVTADGTLGQHTSHPTGALVLSLTHMVP